MICGLVCGVQYLHAKGFVHAELKPSDLLIDERYHLHITEIATHELERRGLVISSQVPSPAYAAPELYGYEDLETDPEPPIYQKVDVFTIGVIIYEMLTGNRAFPPSLSAADIRRKTMGTDRPSLPASLNKDFAGLIGKMWEADHAKRPTIGEVVFEMQKAKWRLFDDVNMDAVMELASEWDVTGPQPQGPA
jgi:serine/threonine-protein kinase